VIHRNDVYKRILTRPSRISSPRSFVLSTTLPFSNQPTSIPQIQYGLFHIHLHRRCCGLRCSGCSGHSLGALTARAGTPSSAGTHNGCYYSWWTDGGAQATYTNGAGGSYSVSWKTGGNLVGGKGWNPGAARYVFSIPFGRFVN
jgi:hypothetical protein